MGVMRYRVSTYFNDLVGSACYRYCQVLAGQWRVREYFDTLNCDWIAINIP